MAIQNRRGDFKDFDPYKMVPGEFAIITSGDPNSKDGTSVYHCFAPGVVKRLTSYEDLKEQVDSSVREIIDERIEEALKDLEISGGGATEEQIEQIETNKQNIENLQQTVDNIKIPAKTSELNNDSGFITKSVNDLANYYLKTQTYSRTEIDNKLSAIPKFSIEVVSTLPTSNISTTTVYLVSTGSETNNLYTEYIYVNNKWEYLGKQTVDLTGYVQKTELSSYYTKTEMESLLTTIRNSIPTKMSQLAEDSTHRTVTDAEKQTWNNKADTATTLAGYGITDGATKEQFNQLSQEIANLKSGENTPDFIIAEAERVANAVQSVRTAQTLTMIDVSDMHVKVDDDTDNHPDTRLAVTYAGMGIKELKKRIHVDLFNNHGDSSWMNANDYTAEQTMKDIMWVKKTLGLDDDELWSVGNHDWCYGSGTDRLLTEDEIYAYIGANSDGVKPNAEIERGYGYIDFDNYKIRVINLNTCDCKDGIDNGTNYHDSVNYARLEFVSPTQMRWLADEALDFTDKGEGWGVVFVSHHPLDYGNVWFTDVLKMLEAYKDGTSVTLNLYKYHNGSAWVRQSETFNFTNITPAEMICNIHGHSHNCGSAKVSSSSSVNPWLWRFCIPNMCDGRENEKWNTIHGEVDESGNAIYHRKETGTAKATAFNVVSIDRKNQKIYAHIFGAGVDRSFYYGEEIITDYSITTTLSNCTGASNNATRIDIGGSVTLKFTANDDYELPDTVLVSGATYTWNKTTGTLTLSNPTADVFVTVTGIEAIPVDLLDMSVRSFSNLYTTNYIEAADAHEMDYTKCYATYSDDRRGKYPSDKFSNFATAGTDEFSASCSSSSGYRLEFPVAVEAGKTYTVTANSTSSYTVKILKYNADTTFNSAVNLVPMNTAGTGLRTATFKPESGYLYSLSFSFGSGARTYTDVSLIEQ